MSVDFLRHTGTVPRTWMILPTLLNRPFLDSGANMYIYIYISGTSTIPGVKIMNH